MKVRVKPKSKRFKKIIFFLCLCIVIFLLIIFRSKISNFIYTTTKLKIPFANINIEQQSDTIVNNEQEQTTDQQLQNGASVDENQLEGNNIIGIGYWASDTSAASQALNADCIYKIKVTSSEVVADDNLVYTDHMVKVKKVYKGQNIKEAKMYSFGGEINKSTLNPGVIKDAANKDNDDVVNVLNDLCPSIEVGKEYIIFANYNNGVLTPVCGNMSFFKINWFSVIRNSRYEENSSEFKMSLRKFEKTYLK